MSFTLPSLLDGEFFKLQSLPKMFLGNRFLCMHWSNEKHGRGHYCKNLKIICIFYLSHDIDALNDVIRREGKLEQDGGFGW